MVHIVTEDSGSGFEFWTIVAEYMTRNFVDARAYTSAGSRGLARKLREMLSSGEIRDSDVLYIALDAVENVSIHYAALNELISVWSQWLNVSVVYTEYHSFEELILSYTRLSEVVGDLGDKSKRWNMILAHEREIIKRSPITFKQKDLQMSAEFNAIVQLLPDAAACKNREKLSKLILYSYTSLSKRWVRVSEGSLGQCWKQSCGYVCRDSGERIPERFCSGCYWGSSSRTPIEKVYSVCRNSNLCSSKANVDTIIAECLLGL